jgi:Small metal-binding protein
LKHNGFDSRQGRPAWEKPFIAWAAESVLKQEWKQGGLSMNRRTFALSLGLGAAVLMAPSLVLAEDHLAEAIKHTKEAIEEGKKGKADLVVTHAKFALEHATAAEKAKENAHVKEGIIHLNAAIDTGKQGDADVATGHAEEALTHLELATK